MWLCNQSAVWTVEDMFTRTDGATSVATRSTPGPTAAPVSEAAPLSAASTAASATPPPAVESAEALRLLQSQFPTVPGYLNAATLGLPPVPVSDALRDALEDWQCGRATPARYDEDVQAARSAYARFVGVPTEWVAVGSQTSVFAGLLAAALPDGAEVVCVEGDFSSMVYPFLVQAGTGRITVRQVPLEEVAAALTERTTLVAFSLCQSACGRLSDATAIAAAAQAVGARTFCDITQSAGWLPVDATRFDATVCSAYKWMCQPRGTAYLTIAPDLAERVRPVHAGWYAGADVWGSCYGPEMVLSETASRFDVSPAWLSWVGAVPALEVMSSVPTSVVHDHDVALADDLRRRLGIEGCRRPVLSLPDPDGACARLLADRGASVASRAGRVRIAFHIWNTAQDVDLVADALAGRDF